MNQISDPLRINFKNWILAAIFFLTLAVLHGLPGPGELEVHVIDVGQGSAVVLRTVDHAVLVDAGQDRTVAAYLQAIGVTHVDLAVASHAHADHIGGFPAVFGALSVGELWYNGQTHTTRTFERFVDTLLTASAVYHEPHRGEAREFGSLVVTSLHPSSSARDYRGNLHDQNIIIRADFGEFAIILPGDAEQLAEYAVLDAAMPLRATVLVLGHHGSRTSSTERFLRAVQPEVVFYQAGVDNRYGHPHREIIRRVQRITGAPVFGTDNYGTIILTATAQGRWTVVTGETRLSPRALCIDVNSASAVELTELVHIGTARAERIIQLRPIASLEALRAIPGIGPARLQDIRDQGLVCPVGR